MEKLPQNYFSYTSGKLEFICYRVEAVSFKHKLVGTRAKEEFIKDYNNNQEKYKAIENLADTLIELTNKSRIGIADGSLAAIWFIFDEAEQEHEKRFRVDLAFTSICKCSTKQISILKQELIDIFTMFEKFKNNSSLFKTEAMDKMYIYDLDYEVKQFQTVKSKGKTYRVYKKLGAITVDTSEVYDSNSQVYLDLLTKLKLIGVEP